MLFVLHLLIRMGLCIHDIKCANSSRMEQKRIKSVRKTVTKLSTSKKILKCINIKTIDESIRRSFLRKTAKRCYGDSTTNCTSVGSLPFLIKGTTNQVAEPITSTIPNHVNIGTYE